MAVTEISVIRANYVNLISNVLNLPGKGYRYDSILQQCNLPTGVKENPDAYVPLNALLSFIRWAEYATGVKNIGLRAASRLTISDFNSRLHSALVHASELTSAFNAFFELIPYEHSNIQYNAVQKRNSVRVYCSLHSGQLSYVDRELEWFSIMSLVTIVRHFMGVEWVPAVITLRTEHPAGKFARRIFPDTKIYTGHKGTGIEIPAPMVNLQSLTKRLRVATNAQPGVIGFAKEKVIWDFPSSLQKLLPAYLNDGYPDINFAAKIIGSSVRTLQRRLKQHNIRYSDLVHQTQIEYAKELLANKNLRTLDVAYAVGYQDHGNFTRAFRRLAGISPTQFRIENRAHFQPPERISA